MTVKPNNLYRTDVTVFVHELREYLIKHVSLEQLNSEQGLDRMIRTPDLHITGLQLTGFLSSFPSDRIQIIGNPEIQYLATLSPEVQRERMAAILAYPIPCLIVTNNQTVSPVMIEEADKAGICLFRVPCGTTYLFHTLTSYLSPRFAPTMTIHATLVDVYGMGLLLTGRSGIGKSEIALDLVERGHRLVADDVVVLKKVREHSLVGAGLPESNHHMEIRGLGILNVPRMFGIRSIRENKRVEVEVRLEDRKDLSQFDRTGLEELYSEYMGVRLPLVNLPIYPGKNITVIAETIALNNILKMHGYDAALEFNNQLKRRMNGSDD